MKIAPGIEVWVELEYEVDGKDVEERMPELGNSLDSKETFGQAYLLSMPSKNFTIHCDATEAFQSLPEEDCQSIGFALWLNREFVAETQARRGIPAISFSGIDCKDGRGFFPFRFLEIGENPRPKGTPHKALEDVDDAITVHACRYRTVKLNHFEADKEFRAIDVDEEPLTTSPILGYGERQEYGDDIIDTSHYEDPVDDINDDPFRVCQFTCRHRSWLVQRGLLQSIKNSSNSTGKVAKRRLAPQAKSYLHRTPQPPSISPVNRPADFHDRKERYSSPDLPLLTTAKKPRRAPFVKPEEEYSRIDSHKVVESLLREIASGDCLRKYTFVAEKAGLKREYLLELPDDLLEIFLRDDLRMEPSHLKTVMGWATWQKSLCG